MLNPSRQTRGLRVTALVAASVFVTAGATAWATDAAPKAAASAPQSAKKKAATQPAEAANQKTASGKPTMKSDTTPNTSNVKTPPKPKVPEAVNKQNGQ